MSRLPVIVAIGVLGAAAAIAYAPARANYVRHSARRHLDRADAMRHEMTSPIVQQAVKGAADELMYALMRPNASTAEIRTLDAALASAMEKMTTSPPPEQPVYLTATYDPSARAGQPFRVRLSVHADVSEPYLVAVTSELTVGAWKSGPRVQRFDRAIGAAPVDVDFVFAIPAGISGAGHVRASGAYRLDPTGEGQDFQMLPKTPLPEVAVAR